MFLVIGGAVAAAALLVAVATFLLLATAPGHALVRRLAVRALQGVVVGRVTIGSVGGSLWRGAELRDVSLETLEGQSVLRAQAVSATFALTDLLRSRFRFSNVLVVRPVVVLEQGVDGRWNIERLFPPRAPGAGPSRRPFVELLRARVVEGTIVMHERKSKDSVIARAAYGLNADLARLRLSHPDSAAVEASFTSFAAHVRNPDVTVTNVVGFAALEGDSLRLALSQVALPSTTASASGRVRWGGRQTALDASVNAHTFAFDDVRALVPLRLPGSGGGSIDLGLRLGADGSREFDVASASIRTGRSAVSGHVMLTLDARGAASVRGMDLDLRPLDLALLRLYADTVPVRGLVRGRLRGEGPLRSIAVLTDVAWADESVEGSPVSTVSAHGRLALGGVRQLVFGAFTVNRSDIDIRTIRRFAPTVDLPGRLHAAGTLDGPWRDASFRGALVHADADGLASRSRGSVRLDLRDTLRIDADLDFDSLSLDLLRRRYSAIPLTGALAGRVTVHGPITALAIDAALHGGAGSFTAKGTVGARDSTVAVAMEGTFDTLDLRYAAGSRLPASALAGQWATDLLVPQADVTAATGTAHVALLPGVVSGVAVGGGAAWLRLATVRVALDSAWLDFEGGTARASGGIGRGAGLPARLDFSVHADTAQYLEPLVRWARREGGDSSSVKLEGATIVSGYVEGTTRAWRLAFAGSTRGVQFGGGVGRGVSANGRLDCAERRCVLAATGAADTVAAGGLLYAPVGVSVSGSLDSLTVRATTGFHVASALRATFTVSGDTARRTVRLDSFDLDLPVRSWHLVRTARFTFTPSTASVDSVELRPSSGAGRVRAAGALPRAGAVAIDLIADSVPIADVYALLQRDTAGISGVLNGSLRIAGRAGAPVIDLVAALADGRFGDYRLPLFRLTAHYDEHRLGLEGGVWRDSLRLLAITGSLPIDLALERVTKRQLAGPLRIVASADSLDMTVLNPLTVMVKDVSGIMSLDVRIEGTWDQPSLTGAVDIWDGAMRVPALGARYDAIDTRLTLTNDVMQVTHATISGAGGGELHIGGQVRFEALTKPVLDLTLSASQFAAFDIKGFGALTASGELALKGPAIGATLSGRIEVETGSLQFRDLVEKRVVSLDDPEFRALVDTNLARAAELAPAARTVFVDSLRIEGLTVALGEDVWLRSSETNIQLDGEFDVERNFEGGFTRLRLDGTLHAVRGTYRLTLGKENSFLALSRDFRVTSGTVRFFGTPDFNPDLDIAAEHVVRTAQGSQLTVRALITGTLLRPELHLQSDAQPPLTETEIVSYLMFGQPPASLSQAGVGGRSEAMLAQAVGSSLVGGVGQALASELGLPLDYLTIVPGGGGSGGSAGVSTARVEAGAQLGDRTFLTLNAGLCEVLAAQLVGATLQYRLSGRWTASATFEPVIQECGTSAGLTGLATRKQFGFDLFWQQGIR